MPIDIVVGGQAGDEGKGKISAYLAAKNNYSYSIRVGGPNAGHTIFFNKKIYTLKTIPAGFVNKKTKLVLGAGTYIIPEWLEAEIKQTGARDRLIIDPHAVVIEPRHTAAERADSRMMEDIGSVGTGLGVAMRERIERKPLTFAKDIPSLKKYIQDVPNLLNKALARHENLLLEGTQGMKLSLLHGEYPHVTSRDTTASNFLAEVGLGPKFVSDIYVIFKPYVTRVGPGPLENEIKDPKELTKYHIKGREVGSVSGRLRRIGLFEMSSARKAIITNSATKIAITHFDMLLGREKDIFLKKIKTLCKIYPYPKTSLISYGPNLFDVLIPESYDEK